MDSSMDSKMDEGRQPHSKRFRRDDSSDPKNPGVSKVVHVRQLGLNCADADILEVMQHFGAVSYITVMQSRRMALVEFEDVKSATNCVQYAQTHAIEIAGSNALVNYSTSKAIQRIGFESDKPNNVLVMHIQNCMYNITVDVINSICKDYGQVQRIAIMRRSGVLALVEFDSVESAKGAKHALNGADIYSGCCTLKIEFSHVDHVRVTGNDVNQWDFTVAEEFQAPAKEARRSLLSRPRVPGMGDFDSMGAGGYGPIGGPVGMGGLGGFKGSGGAGSGLGRLGGGGLGGGAGASALMDTNSYGGMSDLYGGGGHDLVPGGGGPFGGGGAGGSGGRMGMGLAGARGGPLGGGGMGASGPYGEMAGPEAMMGVDGNSAVLMLYGIDDTNWSPEGVFNLLCQYGNVARVKFMKTKKDTAMVEMETFPQVMTLISNISGRDIFDHKITIRPSKQPRLAEMREPFTLPNGEPSFQDFTQDKRNRFFNVRNAEKNRILPPSDTLHFYNCPSDFSESDVTEIFASKDTGAPTEIRLFEVKNQKKNRTGLVKFPTVKEAIEALIKCNHATIDTPENTGKFPLVFKLAFAGGTRPN